MTDFKDYMTVNNIVALILGIIGLIWLIHGLWRNWKINKIRSWPQTNAVVINSVAEPANSNAGNTYVDPRHIVPTTDNKALYIPRVVYRYRIGNKDYQSNRVVYSGAKSYGSLDIQTLLGQVYPGAMIPIYYNPRNHTEAYIYNGTTSWTHVVIGLVLLLIAGYLGYYHHHKIQTVHETKTNINTSELSPNLTDMDTASKKNIVVSKTVATGTVPITTTKTTTVPSTVPATFYRRDIY
jgi:hypothetical protein